MMLGVYFMSCWGFMFVMLGMVVGIGNIWCFLCIVVLNGGGFFFVVWVVFFFLWLILLIFVEFVFGKRMWQGVVGIFMVFMGEKFVWMGGWVVWIVVVIGFYYVVVMGWMIWYLLVVIFGQFGDGNLVKFWEEFVFMFVVLLFYFVVVVFVVVVVVMGI